MSDEQKDLVTHVGNMATYLRSVIDMANTLESTSNADTNAIAAFMLKGMGVDLDESAAAIYKVGRWVEDLAELTRKKK